MQPTQISAGRKVTKIGNGLFIPLPIDVAKTLNVKKGDHIIITVEDKEIRVRKK